MGVCGFAHAPFAYFLSPFSGGKPPELPIKNPARQSAGFNTLERLVTYNGFYQYSH